MSEVLPFEPQGEFGEILAAVQETRRGRWFLEEYRSAIHRAETAAVLNAIHKLETSLDTRFSADTGVTQARQAIASTREKIARIGTGELPPADPHLFRKLAALQAEAANTAGPSAEATALNQRIALALQLVDELDLAMGHEPAVSQDAGMTAVAHGLSPEQKRLFRHDEQFFATENAAPPFPAHPPVPALPAAPPAVVAVPQPTAPRGARLVIKRAEPPAADMASTPMQAALADPQDFLDNAAAPAIHDAEALPGAFQDIGDDLLEPERVADLALAEAEAIAPDVRPAREPVRATTPVTAPATDPAQRIVIIRRPVEELLQAEPVHSAPENDNAA